LHLRDNARYWSKVVIFFIRRLHLTAGSQVQGVPVGI